MQAIILSGGLGTRLHPLTLKTPKPMLPIGGIPHLEYQIRLLAKHGFTDIIFSTGYLHKQIEDYFGDGNKWGVRIQYKEDGEIALGTAGALRNCFEYLDNNDFLVMNGDILTDIDLTDMVKNHIHSVSPITIALTKIDTPQYYGVAVLNHLSQIVDFIEKPKDDSYGNLINSGIYIMNKYAVKFLEEGKHYMLEKEVFPRFAQSHMINGYVADYLWLDIGTHERYQEAQTLCRKIIL